MFNFKRLLRTHMKTLPSLKTTTDGHYDYDNGGISVDGTVTYNTFEGVVLPLGEKLVISNSAYTIEDMKLYTYENISENEKITFKGKEYTTMNYTNYDDYDIGLKVFVLKRGAN